MKKILTQLRIFRLFWFFGYPYFWEPAAFWPFAAYRVAKKLIREHNIELVYTSSAPFSAMLLGFLLKRLLHVKWVADIRDPFTDGFTWRWPSKLHWHISRMVERKICRHPDRLVVVTPVMKKLYIDNIGVNPEKIEVITNGYGG